MSRTIKREPCPECHSKDNLCTFLTASGEERKQCKTPKCAYNKPSMPKKEIIDAEFVELEDRHIPIETCKAYNVQEGTYNDQPVRVYNYNDKDIKVRFIKTKEFMWLNGRGPNTHMFGLLTPVCSSHDKPLIITEGEEDALSLHSLGYQAVSLSGGANSIRECLEKDMQELNRYSEIWLAFDNDSAGITAREEAKKLLTHKLLRVVNFAPYKDANEVLINDRAYLKECLDNSLEIVPPGIIFGDQLEERDFLDPLPEGFLTNRPLFNEMTRGYCKGQMYLWMSGSGIGKSTILHEDVLYLREKYDVKIGNFFLEEDKRTAVNGYIARYLSKPTGDFIRNPLKYVTQEEYSKAWNYIVNTDKMSFHTGDINPENFLNLIEYLAKIKKYDIIVLDHVTELVQGMKVADIDLFIGRFFQLVIQYQFVGIVATQLSNVQMGKDWEEGRQILQSSARNSGSLRYKPDVMIGIERNTRDPQSKDIITTRIVKNRHFSVLGEADQLIYINNTGRLQLKKPDFE